MTTVLLVLPHLCWLVALVLVMHGVDKRIAPLRRRVRELETATALPGSTLYDESLVSTLGTLRFPPLPASASPELPTLAEAARAIQDLVPPPGYRENALPDHSALKPLCGTFEIHIVEVSAKNVRFQSHKAAHGISLTHWDFGNLSKTQRSEIAATFETGKLRVTLEAVR